MYSNQYSLCVLAQYVVSNCQHACTRMNAFCASFLGRTANDVYIALTVMAGNPQYVGSPNAFVMQVLELRCQGRDSTPTCGLGEDRAVVDLVKRKLVGLRCQGYYVNSYCVLDAMRELGSNEQDKPANKTCNEPQCHKQWNLKRSDGGSMTLHTNPHCFW